jgi:hypothetical protein
MTWGIQGGNKTTTGHRVVGHGRPYFQEFMDTLRPSNDSIPLSSNRLSLITSFATWPGPDEE